MKHSCLVTTHRFEFQTSNNLYCFISRAFRMFHMWSILRHSSVCALVLGGEIFRLFLAG
ncbi:hypothetical protein BDV38DRAFT_253710, partial [Aspergillus pseudotamarii]